MNGVGIVGQSALVLVTAGSVACLANAIRLVKKGEPELGIASWMFGVAGVFAVVLIGVPVVFDLFPTPANY